MFHECTTDIFTFHIPSSIYIYRILPLGCFLALYSNNIHNPTKPHNNLLSLGIYFIMYIYQCVCVIHLCINIYYTVKIEVEVERTQHHPFELALIFTHSYTHIALFLSNMYLPTTPTHINKIIKERKLNLHLFTIFIKY